ncbi:MAG: IS3 family transposase [Acidimicrobiia bacterium]|nr:IS3 family transposase [Acidimicrobiia bacterium]
MGRPSKYSDELRRRAVDEVIERGRKIFPDVARDLGIGSPETLRNWVKQARVDRGLEEGPTTEELAEIKKLRKEVADQQRTIEILKAATTYFREGGRPPLQVMIAFVDEHRDTWPVKAMCASIELNERTYYASKARPPSARAVADEAHKVKIRAVWVANYSCYGPRRVHKQLRREGYRIARCTVERLMTEMGIGGVIRGKKRFTTVADDNAARPPDLVDRQFVATRPNELWVADITYVSTWQGWLYVAFVLDVYSRAIVGWQIADHLRTDLVLDALEMAIARRDLTAGQLVHHSDAGCQGGLNWWSQHLDRGGACRWRRCGSGNGRCSSIGGRFRLRVGRRWPGVKTGCGFGRRSLVG